jgi:hypothetical protein
MAEAAFDGGVLDLLRAVWAGVQFALVYVFQGLLQIFTVLVGLARLRESNDTRLIYEEMSGAR